MPGQGGVSVFDCRTLRVEKTTLDYIEWNIGLLVGVFEFRMNLAEQSLQQEQFTG